MKKIVFIFILALAAIGIWLGAARKNTNTAPAYREVRVTRGTLRATILATGTVQPQNRVEIASPVAGRIEDVLVREGDHVTKGQIIAWISSTDRAALLDAARSRGEAELKRWEDLYKATPIVAPLDAEVIARKLEPGQSVSPDKPMLVLSDRLIVKAQVDETDIARIRNGQSVEIQLDAYPDHTIEGAVDHVAYEAETVDNVTIYQIDVLPHDPPGFLRSGMTASLTFIVEQKKNVLLLEADAIKDQTVLRPGHPPKTQEVKTGIEDGKQIEIVSGLSEGDVVLVEDATAANPAAQKGNPLNPWSKMPTRRGPRH